MKLQTLLAGLVFLTFTGVSSAAEQQSDWVAVPGSHDRDFRIYCYEGEKLVMGVFPRGGTSNYQVARDIFIRTLADGRSVLTFQRGFISADTPTTFIPSVNTRCEMSAK
ncbi:hypothetical protein V8O11_20905 [Erwinia aphidicola]|uniref:hypothetical protein n=1 Tax=Erwinia TaxID=551 RepID=UPI00105D9C22|nr:hypothetical protein [Erwinia aphidicola]MCP2234136.1 hypothetical protein [Erwinia aphidicola]